MSAPTPDQISAYARAMDAASSVLQRIFDAVRGGPERQASRKRRAAMRKLSRATRLEGRGQIAAAAVLRTKARALLLEAEALWPLGEEIAALAGRGEG